MSQDTNTRKEAQPMLGYPSTNIVKTAKVANDVSKNNNNDENKSTIGQYSSNFRGVYAQCLVTGAVLILAAAAGFPIGYSAVLLPQLAKTNGTLHADKETGSWIASIHSLATPLGSLISGTFIEAIGRRGALQIAIIPLCVGWIIMGFAKSIPYIIAGRILCGFAVGLVIVPGQVLIGESAEPKIRGALMGVPLAAYSLGILLVYGLGAVLRWETVAFCGTILPGLALVALCYIPESPMWLAKRKKIEAAKRALMWLRGGDIVQTNVEVALLERRTMSEVARMSSTASLTQQASSIVSKILNPGVLKPLVIINVFNFFQSMSGTYVIVFYGVDFIKDIGGDSMDSYSIAVVTAFIRLLFSLIACILLLKMGRRTLGIFSTVGTALTSLTIAGYILAKKGESPMDAYVLGICLLAYVGVNTVGLMCLPGIMVSELLPQRARGVGGGCSFFLGNLGVFAITKLFPMVNEKVGTSGIFTIFGASALLAAVFIYVILPETKGRTLQQIEDYFQEGNIFWVTRTKTPKQNKTLDSIKV